MNPRGMPSVELSDETKLTMELEKKEAEPKSNLEIFVKPIDELSKESVEDDIKVADKVTEGAVPDKPVKKPKKKLTDKQLDALRRGREKSIETRRKKKEAGQVAKAEKILEEKGGHESGPLPPRPSQPVSTNFHQPSIDYDKIINGVVGRMDHMKTQRQDREHLVASNVNAFEEKIREDERKRVLDQIDVMQKEDEQKRASIMAHQYLTKPKPTTNSNPYAYAMQMGSNSRYRRY